MQQQAKEGEKVLGRKMHVPLAASWMDEDSPWLIARIAEAAWNVDISENYWINRTIKFLDKQTCWPTPLGLLVSKVGRVQEMAFSSFFWP